MSDTPAPSKLSLVADVVSAYVSKNSLPTADLPSFIQSVYAALDGLGNTEPTAAPAKTELVPAVPIKKSITGDYIISLEDGRKFKSMKRYLMTTHNMTPEQYREKWGLPSTYPMVAPNYATARSALAKASGLGARGVTSRSKKGTKST
jgi:predicted transcriptional regulator